jgi:hypothetical protein
LPTPLLGIHVSQFESAPPNLMAVKPMKHIVCDDLGMHNIYFFKQLLPVDVRKKCSKRARKLLPKDSGKMRIFLGQ